MGRLIDADELKSKLQARHDNGNDDFDKGYNIGLGTAIDLIDCAPTIEEKPQGEGLTPWEQVCRIAQSCGYSGAEVRGEE